VSAYALHLAVCANRAALDGFNGLAAAIAEMLKKELYGKR